MSSKKLLNYHKSINSLLPSLWLLLLLSLLIASCLDYVDCMLRRNLYPSTGPANIHLNSIKSKPLFLTPYIERGDYWEGRVASEVTNLHVDVESYSGFITVNKTYDSNMFFWFFQPYVKRSNNPLLVWLQGGPGGSSLFGLFVENGPLMINSHLNVSLRPWSWNIEFAVIYIDNPVGTGFSFTKDERGYATNEVEVADNLYEFMRQFLLLFPEYRNKKLFLTGESYAGKYVPAFGYKIHTMGHQARKDGMNLQGLAIGDGFSDPRNMIDYGPFLYQTGLIDEEQLSYFQAQTKEAQKLIDDNQFAEAAAIFDQLLDGDFTNESYFYNATGLRFYYNILRDHQPDDFNFYISFLAEPKVRDAIHVGDLPYGNTSDIVEEKLVNDIMASVKPWIEELLDARYRFLFYSGQLDIIVAAPLTENFLKQLNWHGSKMYLKAPRSIYRFKPRSTYVCGYAREVDNMIQLIIRNAGHILPYDQPKVAYDMIKRFVKNEPY
ncbi:serine carboxypeptidase CPVL-like protein [Sarcoptes scabiei]|uniref:Carboxypeptidase n=1 Tax=Sarcoptes scabiei TaxID=52283 RepID=A0A131ZUF3_SARSC|nr:serine carboxypeptidase CPVL-like protein [Sarcoptes scabiei]